MGLNDDEGEKTAWILNATMDLGLNALGLGDPR